MKYTPDIVNKICELIESGDYTQKSICEKVGISEDIFCIWKNEKSDFSDKINKSEENRLEQVKIKARNSLNKLIEGYEYEETTTIVIDNGEGKPRIKEKRTVKKHLKPDTTAVIFALTNRDPKNYKHKNETDLTTNGKDINNIDLSKMTTEELDARTRMIEKLEENE